MRTFDLNSFWRTLCWMVGTRRHKLLTLFTSSAVVVFIVEGMLAWTFSMVGNMEAEAAIFGMMIFFGLSFCIHWAASQTFTDFGDKQTAIIELMHPASNLEKFVALWVYQIIVYGAAVTLGVLLGDLLRACLEFVLHGGGSENFSSLIVIVLKGTAQALRIMSDPCVTNTIHSYAVCMTVSLFWTHSAYVLGSAFFRNHRFLFTTLALFVLQLMPFMSVWGMAFNPYLTETGDIMYNELLGDSNVMALNAMTLVYVVLIAFNYWLSFRLFKRMQVVSNRWFNW